MRIFRQTMEPTSVTLGGEGMRRKRERELYKKYLDDKFLSAEKRNPQYPHPELRLDLGQGVPMLLKGQAKGRSGPFVRGGKRVPFLIGLCHRPLDRTA